ncbi:MAG: AAA family ATPase [Nanoarchaeota archaeon]|nr:AAA family ATPase [Nanoarchaeota archaeon]
MDLSKFGVEVKENKPQEINNKNLELNINQIQENFKFEEKEKFLPWFLKYKLKNHSELILTPEIKKIINYIEEKPKAKGILLYGRAGSGKTTTLNLLAEKYNFEIFELNASDSRNKKSIEESVGNVIKQKSLFNKNKIIIIDEVDGVSGTYDRGGVAELIKIIKTCPFPIGFTANDKDSDKIKTLKKVCINIDFENNSKELLLNIAQRIFKKENINYELPKLKAFIEERNIIDIRGFINDLQHSTINSNFEPSEKLESRDYKKKIENLLDKIYFSYPEDSYKSSFNSDINIDDLFLYLEENTPNVYTKEALILAFNEISKADIFKGRIMRWQYWRFLVYINFYLTYGISSSKNKPNKNSYKKNQRILKKWIYGNQVNALRPRTKIEKEKEIPLKFIEKLSKNYACSVKKCRSKELPYFVKMYKENKKFQESMNKKFEIDEVTKKALIEF